MDSEIKDFIKEQFSSLKEEIKKVDTNLRAEITKVDTKIEEFKLESNTTSLAIQSDIKSVRDGAFTKEEKDFILSNVKQLDTWFENNVLGEKDISLTRNEYDATAQAVGFDNRFEKEVVE